MNKAEEYVLLARYAERAERFDEMADFMGSRVETDPGLTAEERDMFSAAFKGALTGRRNAVRVAVSVEQQETQEGQTEKATLAAGYRTKVEAELQDVSNKALALLQNKLVPTAADSEAKTFYLKMMGDYQRYIAEFAQGELRARAAEAAKDAYCKGTAEAEALPTVHPVRLGLALNYSVFQHEVLQNTVEAVNIAKQAYEGASSQLGSVPEENRNDAFLTMQLLQDNLGLWEPES